MPRLPMAYWLPLHGDLWRMCKGKSDGSTKKCCTCSPLTRTRTKRSWCLGDCRSAWGQGPSSTDQVFLDNVRLPLPISNGLWQALWHRYPAYWVVYSRLYSWVPGPASVVQDLNWAKHPNKRFCEACWFFGLRVDGTFRMVLNFRTAESRGRSCFTTLLLSSALFRAS